MKALFDLLPLLIFFVAFKYYDIYVATAVAILATFVQVGWFWLRHRRFETMHLITLSSLVVLGGLTIAFQNDAFIKWKPTVVSWVFAALIGGMLATKKTALEYVVGRQLEMPAAVWRKANIAWAVFFLLMGFLNMYFAFYHNLGADAETRTATWVNFKVFGFTGLMLGFSLLQVVFMVKYIRLPPMPGQSE